MKLLLVIAVLFPFSVRAQPEEAAPILANHTHAPIQVRKCTCRDGTVKDSRVPKSTCPASIRGHIEDFPIYNDLCRTIQMSQRYEGPTETSTSFLGPKEVIVGVSYGEGSFELSEQWMRAVLQ